MTERLPRAIEADPRAAAVHAALGADRRALWSAGTLAVPNVPYTARLDEALRVARRQARLVLGLEAARATLAAERAGLDHLAARGERIGPRVSRVLVVARDGAERLYRATERLALDHPGRVLVLRADVDAATLGGALAGRDREVKLVLATHREAVASILLALAPPG